LSDPHPSSNSRSGVVPITLQNSKAVFAMAESHALEPWDRDRFYEDFNRANWKAVSVLDRDVTGFAVYHRDRGTGFSTFLNMGAGSDVDPSHDAVELLWNAISSNVLVPSQAEDGPEQALIIKKDHLSVLEKRISSPLIPSRFARIDSTPLGSDARSYCAIVPGADSSLAKTFSDNAAVCEKLMEVWHELADRTDREWLMRHKNGGSVVWMDALSRGVDLDDVTFVDTKTVLDLGALSQSVVAALPDGAEISAQSLQMEGMRAVFDYSVQKQGSAMSDAVSVVDQDGQPVDAVSSVAPNDFQGLFGMFDFKNAAAAMKGSGLVLHIPARLAVEGRGDQRPHFEVQSLEAS